MKLSAILLGGFVLPACSRGAQELLGVDSLVPPGRRASAVEPVGERCIDCHADVVRAYRETGMARAVEPVRPDELAGLEPVVDAAGWSYRLEPLERGGRIVETWKDGHPAVTADLAFAIGAGLMDRSYAAAVGDLLWFAPAEVMTAGGGRHAALAPGHAIRPSMRFTSPIAEECLACHTDRLAPRDYPLNLRPDPTVWSPAGISCAACHGDVEAHADWREADLAGREAGGKDPILTASRAGTIESLSVCARCHLQGDASLLLEPGARGVLPPGGDVLSKRAVFVAASTPEEIRFVSQVERLVLSPCFTESSKPDREPLTCVTCHDPHRSSFDPDARRAVRDACGRCHAAEGMHCSRPIEERAGHDCVDCHMRRTGVFDVAEVEIHDHFIRKDPGPPSVPAALRVHESKDGKLALFAWPGRPAPAYAGDAGLWAMAYVAAGQPELAMPLAERGPGEFSARLATYYHLRGSLLEAADRPAEARAAYTRALELDPKSAETSVNLGLLLGELGRPRDGVALLGAVVDAHPKASPALRNRAVLRLQLGDERGFASDLQAAFEIAPDAAVAAALAKHFDLIHDAENAGRWRRLALALDPSLAPPPR